MAKKPNSFQKEVTFTYEDFSHLLGMTKFGDVLYQVIMESMGKSLVKRMSERSWKRYSSEFGIRAGFAVNNVIFIYSTNRKTLS
jgi:hypothetical protein